MKTDENNEALSSSKQFIVLNGALNLGVGCVCVCVLFKIPQLEMGVCNPLIYIREIKIDYNIGSS